ncbi:response regulator [Wohlfahrtiimonas chitiniclastica]|uniref:Protein pilH n=2 Tax=Wohlfahrtiimonas chitiniclastica TaxID=400946 RepID=L8XYC8_9GAMM|nr:response regulator [Wohlfahrtiimonas chitiniclastica]ELV07824.1 Protein pilH [Wohlfahrtiimonas chitiniclastica SH04]KZS23450.1 two-component system response regulator [Wohlfahrtiimonas chitiniclastica]KZX36942.1 two-component system response regulator [Wohlfahrtiimonas chitiniclastica]MBS7815355.1 response regulator [Wohlfahrtiimonas chitiniclastica]MBS7817467.1 response regulator [Wohlfahrtiimonas chitiniclastica]
MAKILIADDSKLQKLEIARFLKKLGHIVLEAQDGFEAIDLANVHLPDLILLDVVMPSCNGFSALRKIKSNEKTQHIPIMMVSTKSEDIDKIWASKQGAVGYITKPIDFVLLEAEINKNL